MIMIIKIVKNLFWIKKRYDKFVVEKNNEINNFNEPKN